MTVSDVAATESSDVARLLTTYGSSLAEHRRRMGVARSQTGQGLVAALRGAGLTGRGGAGFPIARKLEAAAGPRAVVVGNGAEGEPLSRKDATLLAAAPHLVLDGLCAVADAIGALSAYLYVSAGAAPGVRHAVEERAAADGRRPEIEVVEAPDLFIAGEETAVISRLEGKSARPRDRVVPAAVAGLARRPTVISNVETLAHVALIARYGAAWFRSVGSSDAPGTMLVTLSGAIRDPGVYEVATGTPLAELLRRHGGTDPSRVRAVLVGGFHGAWLDAEAVAQAALSRSSLAEYGATPGAGIVHVLGMRECGLARTADIVDYLAAQSAGQCGPCVNGLPRLAGLLREAAYGRTYPALVEQIRSVAGLVDGRGSCRHPDGTARLVRSALHTFAGDIAAHRAGCCEAGAR